MDFHIATSPEIADDVRIVHHKRVSFVADNLLVGPCALEPEAHCEQRIDFWGFRGGEQTQYRASFRKVLASLQSCGTATIWTSRLWSDMLMSWALCAWRLRIRPEQPGVELILLRREAETEIDYGSIGIAPPDIRENLPKAERPLPATGVQEMAQYWRAVTGQAPVLSAEVGTGDGPQELAALGAYQAAFFPRKSGSTLGLSRFDELLFSCLSGRWSTPLDVFNNRSRAGEALRKWLTLTGKAFLVLRLRAWSLGDDAALESKPLESKPLVRGNARMEAHYRFTDIGKTIRRDGLAASSRGAPLPVWGSTAYDPRALWVEQSNGSFRLL